METVAVILTGGRSSRMGRDKCALRLGGETFLERLVERYRGAFGRVCVSVDRPGRFDPAGAEEVCDRRPGRQGPLAGLEAAFLQTGAEAIFLTAVDLPFGDAALARRLEQLCADYGRGGLGAVSACLEEGRRAFRGMLERVDCRTVDEAELPGFDLERILLNVNRPEDYAAARAAAEEAEG